MNKIDFLKKYDIIFEKADMINGGTIKVMFNKIEFILKNKETGELLHTGIFSNDKDFGKNLVIEKYCNE